MRTHRKHFKLRVSFSTDKSEFEKKRKAKSTVPRMKSIFIFLVVTSNQYWVHCFFINLHNDTERFRRNTDNMEKMIFGTYNEHIEKPRYFERYDFIIVGSGPGGCVLANRLSENPKWNVLLIEAGDVESPLQSVPIMAPYSVFTKYNWGYLSEPQSKACLGRQDNRCASPRGRALGGSSVIYFLLHTRGNRRDFDRWAEAGNYGWSYDEILPYFIKSEKANLGRYSDSPYHNKNGPWSVTFNSMRTPLGKAFVDANKAMGLKEIDYNANEHLGVGYVQTNTMNGRRHSAYRAFIEPVLKRDNLHIMINTKVIKVLIDPKSKSAYGVELVRNRKKYRITAKNEVILSSGAFHSPQLLTLSGIGLRKDLKRLGIPLIKELPVGRNMHDHITFTEMTFVTNRTDDLNFMTYINSVFQYMQGRGLMTLPAGVEALGFIKTPTNSSRGPNVPDIELVFTPGSVHFDRGFGIVNAGRMKREIYNEVYKPLEGTKYSTFLISLMLFHPQSIGRIEIPSANPFSDPKIYGNYFEDPVDVETILYGIKYVMKLIQTEPFRKVGTRLHSIPMPYCKHLHFGSDNYWRCAIRAMAVSIQHQVGTCKMGPIGDRTAVVSPELKVHGINRLRIVDTSIIPEAPTAHTNAISVMIGEKASDLIKKEWRRS